jgi:hypothetical protein
MPGLFKSIAKGLLILGGTVLSIINPAIGAPLIVAGTAIKTDNTVDPVIAYGSNLEDALKRAAAMQGAGNSITLSLMFQKIVDFIKQNGIIIIIGIAGLIFIPKLLKHKRR